VGVPPDLAAAAPARRAAKRIPATCSTSTSRLLERAAARRERGSTWRSSPRAPSKARQARSPRWPVIETQARWTCPPFVPTNVISITDGQIFLETDLFNAGIRPRHQRGHLGVASRRRRGRPRSSRSWAAGVRLALAQYRELAAFAQFASDLDEATRKQLERGRHGDGAHEAAAVPAAAGVGDGAGAVRGEQTATTTTSRWARRSPAETARCASTSSRSFKGPGGPHRVDQGPHERTTRRSCTTRSRISRRTRRTKERRMAGSKEIRTKIKSVQNTRKITKAHGDGRPPRR